MSINRKKIYAFIITIAFFIVITGIYLVKDKIFISNNSVDNKNIDANESQAMSNIIVSGVIEEISGDELSIKSRTNTVEAVNETLYTIKNFKLRKDAEILIQTSALKTESDYNREYESFTKLIEDRKSKNLPFHMIEAPSWNKFEKSGAASLKPSLNITAYINSNSSEIVKVVIKDSQVEGPPADPEARVLEISGKVLAFNKDIIKLGFINPDSAGEKIIQTKDFKISDKTEFYILEKKVSDDFKREEVDFSKEINSNSGDIASEAPSIYNTSKLSLEEAAKIIENRNVILSYPEEITPEKISIIKIEIIKE